MDDRVAAAIEYWNRCGCIPQVITLISLNMYNENMPRTLVVDVDPKSINIILGLGSASKGRGILVQPESTT